MPVTTFAKKQYGAELILTPVSAGRHITSHQKAFCSKYEELVVDCISGYPRSGGWETNWLHPQKKGSPCGGRALAGRGERCGKLCRQARALVSSFRAQGTASAANKVGLLSSAQRWDCCCRHVPTRSLARSHARSLARSLAPSFACMLSARVSGTHMRARTRARARPSARRRRGAMTFEPARYKRSRAQTRL